MPDRDEKFLEIKGEPKPEAEPTQAEHDAQSEQSLGMVELVKHVQGAFDAAQLHKNTAFGDDISTKERLLRCKRQREGVYELSKLALIQEYGGSTTLANITQTKCGAVEAQVKDVMTGAGEKPWSLTPTPIPDLPDDAKDRIAQEVVLEASAEAVATGTEMSPLTVQRTALDALDDMLKKEFEEATERVQRMEKRMEDQLAEGGFKKAMDEFIQDLTTYPLAIIKGPVIRPHKRMAWTEKGVTTTTDFIPTFNVVSTHDIYPAPNAKDFQDAYICEIYYLDAAELASMRGVDGWSDDAINAILDDVERGIDLNALSGEAERAQSEGRDMASDGGRTENTLRCIDYWGCVQGHKIMAWGDVEGVDDENDFYDLNVLLVGGWAVHVILNPDPLGRFPYSATSFEKVSGNIFGRAIAEKMRWCADGFAACVRNMENNYAMASLPQPVIDLNCVSIDENDKIMIPGRIWGIDGTKVTQGVDPVDLVVFDPHIGQYLDGLAMYKDESDDAVGIARLSYGDADAGAAANTATGATILAEASSLSNKRLVGYIDEDILVTILKRLHAWNLKHLDDPSIKGDVIVIPRGVLGILQRKEVLTQLQDYLSRTLNETDLMQQGIKGRAYLNRKVLELMHEDPDKIIGTDEEIEQRTQEQLAGQMPQAEALAGAPR